MNKAIDRAEKETQERNTPMLRIERQVAEYCFAFMLGAGVYSLLEILWRGFTHWTMTLTGGLCCCAIWGIAAPGKRLRLRTLPLRCFLAALTVTAAEFSVGCLVNLLLRWNVWDYSALPGNLLGQICPAVQPALASFVTSRDPSLQGTAKDLFFLVFFTKYNKISPGYCHGDFFRV